MKSKSSLESLLAADKQLIDRYLAAIFAEHDERQAAIVEAMSYSLNAGGKRWRAALLLHAYANIAGDVSGALPFAAAVELIHCYSLIHDDLPAMDDDVLRRGKPTNHVVYGEAMAILAGDGLLNYAFELMLNSSLHMPEPQRAIEAMLELARAAGYRGMLGGQVADIRAENTTIDSATLDYIHINKTAALIVGALVCGATLAGCDEQTAAAYRAFGTNLGLTFQIVDDILDVTGNSVQLGKTIGSDSAQHKTTYVSMYGLTKAREMAKHYSQRAADCLHAIDDKDAFFSKLNQALLKRVY